MKLQASYTNSPAWRNITVKSELPNGLKKLEELSKNLWWVWNSEAKSIFRELDSELWRSTGENPVMVLQQLSSDRTEQILNDKDLMARIEKVYNDFKSYMSVPMRNDIPSVSYSGSGRPAFNINSFIRPMPDPTCSTRFIRIKRLKIYGFRDKLLRPKCFATNGSNPPGFDISILSSNKSTVVKAPCS